MWINLNIPALKTLEIDFPPTVSWLFEHNDLDYPSLLYKTLQFMFNSTLLKPHIYDAYKFNRPFPHQVLQFGQLLIYFILIQVTL